MNYFSISHKETSLNERWLTFSKFCPINEMLRWFLHVLTALSTASVIQELESTLYHFSLIFRVFAAFLKKICSVPLILK